MAHGCVRACELAHDGGPPGRRIGLESALDPQRNGSEMANADKRKQSLYFPEDMLKEIQHEAQRLDRSLSWIVQQGWKLAREKMKAFPASNDDPEGLPDPREETI
jgi:uncharacterized small protein (TIGR04563 family)